MLINLKKSEDELWMQIGGLRTDVRKGEKKGVDIILHPTEQDLAEAYELYLIMMKKKFLPVEKEYKLKIDNLNTVIVAKKDKKVISYISFQLFSNIDQLGKTKICALGTIASDDKYTGLSANSLLYWEGIKYMKSLGFEYLNFNGVSYQYAEKYFYSLTRYKRKYSGLEIRLFSKKSFLAYVYWRFLRRYLFVKKIVYYALVTLFPKKYLKY